MLNDVFNEICRQQLHKTLRSGGCFQKDMREKSISFVPIPRKYLTPLFCSICALSFHNTFSLFGYLYYVGQITRMEIPSPLNGLDSVIPPSSQIAAMTRPVSNLPFDWGARLLCMPMALHNNLGAFLTPFRSFCSGTYVKAI